MDKAINNLLNPLGHLKNEIFVSTNFYSNSVLAQYLCVNLHAF